MNLQWYSLLSMRIYHPPTIVINWIQYNKHSCTSIPACVVIFSALVQKIHVKIWIMLKQKNMTKNTKESKRKETNKLMRLGVLMSEYWKWYVPGPSLECSASSSSSSSSRISAKS